MFEEGSLAVHPGHGTCLIEKVALDAVYDVVFYVMRPIAEPSLQLRIACSAAERVGLRPLVSKAEARRIWAEVLTNPKDLNKDYKKRDKEVQEALRRGDLIELACACRGLMKLDKNGKISQSQKAVLNVLLKRVFSEMSAAMEVDYEEIMQDLKDAI